MSSTPPPPPSSSTAAVGAGHPFAAWGTRVGAYLIDWLVAVVPAAILAGIGALMGDGGLGTLLSLLASVAALAIVIWNQGVREGQTGQSIGKGVLDIETIEEGGGYLGAGQGVLRVILMGLLGSLCFLNYLWPLFDDQNRCWHDMIINSRVVTA